MTDLITRLSKLDAPDREADVRKIVCQLLVQIESKIIRFKLRETTYQLSAELGKLSRSGVKYGPCAVRFAASEIACSGHRLSLLMQHI
ncbi:hypothetical protein DKP76_07370 [Falsochrobactrum shanghaiense]|uniref:Uncharacterized protein n=1 Tax=Falsochrobactrum shanghaiense TaxID=2201899 RepID=A0A316JAH1_9HYPH|nr:hypothetical protein DKP76_07370 [Falsochrobactrum shanghaiense]